MTVAIIGAGMAGLTAARLIAERTPVVVFDKSRGVGGRMSTRYAGDYEFDHGAQYFTVTDPNFAAFLDTVGPSAQPWDSRGLYLRRGSLEADTGRPRWVGTPRMNALPKAMADGLEVRLGARVSALSGGPGAVRLSLEDGSEHGPFTHAVLSVPAPQAAALLAPSSPLQARVAGVSMHACFALMVGFPKEGTDFAPGWDTLRVSDLPVGWIARNSAKPGRPDAHHAVVVHAAPEWSDRNVDTDREDVRATLLECASALCGVDLFQAPHIALHRWLYAYSDAGVGEACLQDAARGLVVAGDWCVGGRVEGAHLSGRAAAQAVLRDLG